MASRLRRTRRSAGGCARTPPRCWACRTSEGAPPESHRHSHDPSAKRDVAVSQASSGPLGRAPAASESGEAKPDTDPALADVLDCLLGFGAAMMRAGDTAFRVREWTGAIARAMGVEALSVRLALGGITASARRGSEHATLTHEIAPPGIDAWRLGALENLARDVRPGLMPAGLAAKLAAIEAQPPLYLLQHQGLAGITRLAYGTMLLLAAAFGLTIVAAIAGLSATPASPLPLGEPLTLLLRAIASFCGGCGFAILYNSSSRTVLAVGALALVGNELRLALNDAGITLAPATVLGAFAVGLLASLARPRLHEPRIALTVPGIIIMVPGTYAFQTVVLFDQGDTLAAMQAAVLGGFVVGAMALGLAAARFVSDRGWAFET